MVGDGWEMDEIRVGGGLHFFMLVLCEERNRRIPGDRRSLLGVIEVKT